MTSTIDTIAIETPRRDVPARKEPREAAPEADDQNFAATYEDVRTEAPAKQPAPRDDSPAPASGSTNETAPQAGKPAEADTQAVETQVLEAPKQTAAIAAPQQVTAAQTLLSLAGAQSATPEAAVKAAVTQAVANPVAQQAAITASITQTAAPAAKAPALQNTIKPVQQPGPQQSPVQASAAPTQGITVQPVADTQTVASAVPDADSDIRYAQAEPQLMRGRIDLAAQAPGQKETLTSITAPAADPAKAGIQSAVSGIGQSLDSNLAALTGTSRATVAKAVNLSGNGAAPVQELIQPQGPVSATADAPAIQAVSQTQAATAATATSSAPALQLNQAMAQQPAAQQLALHIARGVREGTDRIEVQLHPAELGRVDVKMELGHDGRVMAVISAEKTETLEQLRRDVHQLEKALADAGFDADRESFRFDGDERPETADGGEAAAGDDLPVEADQIAAAALASRVLHLDGLGLDIRV